MAPVVPAPERIRVVLLSDSELFLEGLRRILAADAALTVVGELGVPPACELLRSSSPHILLVDGRVDRAVDICREVRESGARPRVILTGVDHDEAWEVRALEAGARGVLAKNATADNLLKAVRVVHAGEVWACKGVVARTVEKLAAHSPGPEPDSFHDKRLSGREQECAEHTAEGLSNREIAGRPGISEATVKAHLTHIFQKLGVRDRIQLVTRYHRGHGAATGNKPSGS